jgi:glyoxylate carboligase
MNRKMLAVFGAATMVGTIAACGSIGTPAAPAAATTVPTTAAAVLVKMPNAVGMVLQDAQDLMQKLTANPVYITKSHDVRFTRLQILDKDWKVCSQNVKKGTKFNPASTTIDFGVVKLAENCP